MCSENTDIKDILEMIIILQQHESDCGKDNTCTKPFLGPNIDVLCYNTRPITLYCCGQNKLWTMPYTLNDVDNTSTVFRIENLDDECATFRILSVQDDGTYLSTNDYFTIRTSCIGALKCLNDVNISLT